MKKRTLFIGLVGALAAVTGKTPRVEHSSVPRGDVEATFADISKAREALGWAPRISLRDGLSTVREWVEANP